MKLLLLDLDNGACMETLDEIKKNLLNAIDKFNLAMDGNSGDAEIDAACAMRDLISEFLEQWIPENTIDWAEYCPTCSLNFKVEVAK